MYDLQPTPEGTQFDPSVAGIRWRENSGDGFYGVSTQGVSYVVSQLVADGWTIVYHQDGRRWVRIPIAGLETSGQAEMAALGHAAATLAESL